MGLCASAPVEAQHPAGQGLRAASLSKARSITPSDVESRELSGSACGGRSQPATGARRAGPAPDIIPRVHALQQEVALLSSQPLLALSEAVELLSNQMGVDFVGVCVYAEEEDGCALLLAMHGEGATTLKRHTVMRGPEWSAGRLAQDGAPARVHVPDTACHQGLMPRDCELLHQEAGMRSFLAVAIGPAGDPYGALLLAKRHAYGFDDTWSTIWPTAVATGLLSHVRPAPVSRVVRMLLTLDAAEDPVSAISAALQSGARFMLHATNIQMGVRLALLGPPGGENAMIFESARAATCGRAHTHVGRGGGLNNGAAAGGGGSASIHNSFKSVALPVDPVEDVTVRELPLGNTLLASAVGLKKARFVKDCASYMQNCPTPARDVFTHASHQVSSLVVVPLLVDDRALGALYFTQDTPCDFSNIQDALLGFVHCVTPTLHHKLTGQMDALRSMMVQPQSRRCSSENQSSTLPSSGALRSGADGSEVTSDDLDYNTDAAVMAILDGAAPCSANAGPSSGPHSHASITNANASARLSKISSRQLCTEAMLKVLQQEIRRGRRRSAELSACADLVVCDAIGRGGFGSVFKGFWHSIPAAIKIMNARSSNSEAVSDAMEMAVLSSVQHPNIVQVYACLTDMVAVDDCYDSMDSCLSGASSTGAGGTRPRFRRLMPGELIEESTPTYSIMVLEFCDRGTLKDAVTAGVFHRRMPNGDIGVDLSALLDVLLDVAVSVQYLHSISLLHGDIKLDNVLLKSEAARPLGLAPKLADFGLTKIVRGDDQVVNHSGAGTVTHLAPEMFQAGTRVTTAVDVYAFGVLMWEFYTGRRAFAGLTKEAVIEHVYVRNARPRFPSGAPKAYVELATACWAAGARERPTSADVVSALQRMSADTKAQAQGAAPAGAPPAAALPAAARGAAAAAAGGSGGQE